MPVAGGLALAIRLRFHNHAPQEFATCFAFHQQAADQLRCHLFCGAAEERSWQRGEVLDGRGDYGSGLGNWVLLDWDQQMNWRGQTQAEWHWVLSIPSRSSLKAEDRKELSRSRCKGAAGSCPNQSRQASKSRRDLQRTDCRGNKQFYCLWQSSDYLRAARKTSRTD